MNERDEKIIQMIDDQRMTLTAVARFFGISKQRVFQIYQKHLSDRKEIETSKGSRPDFLSPPEED